MKIIIINILFTSNNIIVTINFKILNKIIPIKTISSGTLGFKNIKKKTPLACLTMLNYVKNFCNNKFISFNIYLYLKGIHYFKYLIFNTFFNNNLFRIVTVIENYQIAYNGCKLYKNYNLIK